MNTSYTHLIEMSRKALEEAQNAANSTTVAATKARTIYSDARGMWRKIQADARRVVALAEKHGLSLKNPVAWGRDRDGNIMAWGLTFSDGTRLIPLFGRANGPESYPAAK